MITNIKFSGGWFSTGNFEVEDNELIWWRKKLKWKWLIIPTLVKEYYSMPLDEVAYFVPYYHRVKRYLKYPWLSPQSEKSFQMRPFFKNIEVALGTKEIDEDATLKMKPEQIKDIYNLFADNGSEAMSAIDNIISEKPGTKTRIKNYKTVAYPNTLWLYPNLIIGVFRCKKGTYEISKVVCSEARFFTSSRSWRSWSYFPLLKLPKRAIYFGFMEQIEAVLSNKEEEKVKTHLINYGAPFAAEQKYVSKNSWTPNLLFSPKLWFVSERIALTDDAIIYQRRGIYGTEMSYVPFSEISFVLSKPLLGIFPQRIYMLGQQNIVTLKSFAAKHLIRLRTELEERIKKITENGIVAKSCWLARLCTFNFANQLVAVSEGGLSIIGTDEDKNKSFGFSPLSGIEEWAFVRKHWYSLVSALWVSGDYGNIRKDQVSHFSTYVTGIWLCKRRELTKLFKKHCLDEKVEDKDDLKTIKSIIFDSEKSGGMKVMGSNSKSLGKSMIFKILKH